MSSNDGNSSTPKRPAAGDSPRRRSAASNAPRGRGPSPRPPRELALFPAPGGSSGGASGTGSLGLGGGQAVPVGEGSSSGGGMVRIGGSPLGRKRGREAAGEGSGGGDVEGGRNYHCSVCNKAFGSPRAVFGHMRKHPDRGWTGAHPPPAFRAEEEFADIRVAAEPDAEAEAEAAAEEEANYRVPDLNNPPPPDSN